MAGLLSMGAEPAAEAEPMDSDVGEEMPNVTPEEQAQYESFITNGWKVLYGPKSDGQGGAEESGDMVRPDILNRLKESSDPQENLANTAAWLVTMLETSAESNGAQLDDAVVLHAGKALFEELAEIAEAANIHDYSEQEMEGAWYRALDVYRETATQDGRIDPDALKEQFGEIEQAGQEGRMGDVLPQLGGREAPAPTEEGM